MVGRLCNELWKDRIDPITLMSAADERISRFRHSIPTEKKVERVLMVSVNARKGGLIVSLTRFVHFGKIPPELKERYAANVWIDCMFMAATRPGVPAAEVLRKGIEAYRVKGYPEEWKLHHQGGSIGYTGRDYRCNFQTPDIVQENQAFTWNPSLTGTKSEDTILAAAGGAGDDHPADPLPHAFGGGGGDRLREAGYPREGLNGFTRRRKEWTIWSE